MVNRIGKTESIRWRELKPLQPNNSKVIFNYRDIDASILKYVFVH